MTDPLLYTKLSMPPLRSELVRRDRLLERLGAGLRRGARHGAAGEFYLHLRRRGE
jgi:ATP/maltotriose-dependent transcriptional regulator MalT